MLHHLAAGYNASRKGGYAESFDRMVGSAFTSNAANIINALIQPSGRAQRYAVGQTMLRVQDLEAAQIQLMGTLNNQTKLLTSNFATLATLLDKGFVGPLTAIVGGAASGIGNANNYFAMHPGQATVAGGALALWGAWAIKGFIESNLGHFALHAFRRAAPGVGIGGSVYGLGGKPAGAAADAIERGRIWKLFTDGAASIMRLDATRAVPGLIDDILYLGRDALKSKAGLELMTGALGRLGLKVVPVIGELSLVSDAMRLLGAHAGDTGAAIGRSARWIHDFGAPMLGNAVMSAFKTLGPAIFKAIVDLAMQLNPVSLLQLIGKTGADMGKAIRQGYLGGGTRPVVLPPLGQGGGFAPSSTFGGPSAGAPGSGPVTINVKVISTFKAAANVSDATARRQALEHGRKLGGVVAEVLNAAAKTGAKAAGSTIASVGMSNFEVMSSYA